jgi:hypothetical protein
MGLQNLRDDIAEQIAFGVDLGLDNDGVRGLRAPA